MTNEVADVSKNLQLWRESKLCNTSFQSANSSYSSALPIFSLFSVNNKFSTFKLQFKS